MTFPEIPFDLASCNAPPTPAPSGSSSEESSSSSEEEGSAAQQAWALDNLMNPEKIAERAKDLAQLRKSYK